MADTVVLDLDGTISNPHVGIARSINFALSHFGFEPKPEQELARFIGPPLDQTFEVLCGKGPAVVELVAKYRERYVEVGYAENTIYPGVSEVLVSLSEAGVRLGVCTSKRSDIAQKVLEMFGVSNHFSFVHGGDVGITKKDQILELRATGEVTATSWMVGDRDIDILAARAAEMFSAGVLWGFGSKEELDACRPDRLLAKPRDLITIPVMPGGTRLTQ